MKTSATAIATAASFLAVLAMAPTALAQGCNLGGTESRTLRTPLIQGASQQQPGQSADPGQPPAIGDGSSPAPVTPGMGGSPTLLPYNNYTPTSNIGQGSYAAPFSPEQLSGPGELGPNIYVPPPNSTPGSDPGIIHAPLDFRPPPVSVVTINPGGGIQGSAPTERWGGQTTADFGRYKKGRGKFIEDHGIENYGSRSEAGRFDKRDNARGTEDRYGRRLPTRTGTNTIQTICPH